ncbi:MAG: T9SS type A sorting domain-containing protein [Bacteroidales bacterium]|jgi:hypothetical protein|nr:T9SS type A sorting domain-containing protein [Bacteroidales bacterium]
MKTYFLSTILIFLALLLCPIAQAQEIYEFGDAPESVIAYPSSGVIGWFPTCMSVGTNWVQHNNFGAQLGPTFDFEPDGNGGICPSFAPYDNDECFQDGDAGLMMPEPYTIVSNNVVPCPGFTGTPLGFTCVIASWGIDVDIDVANFMPSQTLGFLNVLMDFNQNGVWGDHDTCAGVPVPEHVLINFPIPNGFAGPVSVLGPPPFTIGNHSGYVWTRFSITEAPVATNWDGHGFFEDGESEDYLLEITPTLQSDFGDAPEDVLAYPSNGVVGAFPTCIGAGSNTWVEHLHMGADLGPAIDLEPDGNAGQCPGFSPYDDDECYNDGDAGLLIVESFTIVGGAVTPCPGVSGQSLGYPCDTAVWGTDIDIHANNLSPTQMDMFMNVLFDWNKDGDWGDTVYCGGVMVPEHVLQNFVIPFNFSGPISGLMPPDFIIGPDPGYFWSRFTISDQPVQVPWDGAGIFEDGETEDYLIKVDTASTTDEYEYGDAPEGPLAYPSISVMGSFPTCTSSGPLNHYVEHQLDELIYFGPSKDFEPDGNAGLCSPYVFPYNNDECFADGDAGLILPQPYTIISTGGFNVVVPCTANGSTMDTICSMVHWGPEVDIDVTNLDTIEAVVNVLMDFNRDGQWALDTTISCAGNTVYEHVLVNFGVPPGYSGPLSALNPPPFLAGPRAGYVWARFTVSERNVANNWNGVDFFDKGETEDYLLRLDIVEDIGEIQYPDIQLRVFPNPSVDGCVISYQLQEPARVRVDVIDVSGRIVKTFAEESQSKGNHMLRWNGDTAEGMTAGSGIYFIRIMVNDMIIAHSKLLLKK